MRLLKAFVVFLLLLVAMLVGVAFLLPSSAHVERSITIARPAAEVFALLDGYRRFNEWSPWAAKDPHAQYTISGPASGVGARLSWRGNPATVASGSMEIIASAPYASVTSALDFGNRGKATARFGLTPTDHGTRVAWTLDTQAPLALDPGFLGNVVGRYVNLFVDGMVGPDYENGLRRLKALVESFSDVDIAGIDGEAVQLAPRKIYFVSASSAADPAAAHAVLLAAYDKLGKYLAHAALEPAGPPLTITTSWGEDGWKFDAAVPVDRNDVATVDDIQSGLTYAGPALQFLHVGAYDELGTTITKAYAWAAVHGYTPHDRLIEDYLDDPRTTPPAQLRTRVTIPVE